MYGEVVDEVDGQRFEQALTDLKEARGVAQDVDLTADDLRELVATFVSIYAEETGRPFPQRRVTSCAVPTVPCSTRGDATSPGVPVTRRHPARSRHGGERGPDGLREPRRGVRHGGVLTAIRRRGSGGSTESSSRTHKARTSSRASARPGHRAHARAHAGGVRPARRHARPARGAHYHDLQDIEFTVEEGTLYLLEHARGSAPPAAALRVAGGDGGRGAHLARGGGRAHRSGSARPAPASDDRSRCSDRGGRAWVECVPGVRHRARSCSMQTPPRSAARRASASSSCWRPLPTTSTGSSTRPGCSPPGGMTSHAAVVARGMGKPCVAGCEELSIDVAAGTLRIGEHDLRAGDVITIDGGSGSVIVGSVPLVPPRSTRTSKRSSAGPTIFAGCACEPMPTRRRMPRGPRVRRGGHRPLPDGAHVHGRGPAPVVREMILAREKTKRRAALKAAAHAAGGLRGDLRGDGRSARDHPASSTCSRFLPPLRKATSDAMRDRIRQLQESNPMLGTRGCRLGLQFPEIYEMQVRAIVRAARVVRERTGEAPLVRGHASARRLHRGARKAP